MADRMRNLTSQKKLEDGTVERYANEAFYKAMAVCQESAKKGRPSANVEVCYPGCRGGNENIRDLVTRVFIEKMKNEGFDVAQVSGNSFYNFKVRW